jgi:hypothetical protein
MFKFQNHSFLKKTTCVVAAVFLLVASQVYAATVQAVAGEVQLERKSKVTLVSNGVRFQEGDQISSSTSGEVLVKFDDGAQLALRRDSAFVLEKLANKGASTKGQKTINLIKGGLRYISGKKTVRKNVLFFTNTAAVGIRGTDIEISLTAEASAEMPSGTYLRVNTGNAYLQTADGANVSPQAGEMAFGGLPELMPRGLDGRKRPAAQLVKTPVDVFAKGSLDQLMGGHKK